MRRVAILLLLLAVMLCGCAKREYGILEYQDKDVEAECIVNEKYRVKITKTDEKSTVTVLEPKSAEGISFEIFGDCVALSSGEMTIRADKSSLGGVCALGSIFSQREDALTSAKEEGEGSVLTFCDGGTTFVFTMGEGSLPKRVKITGDGYEYTVEICSIKLT